MIDPVITSSEIISPETGEIVVQTGRIAVFLTAKPDLYVDMLARDMVDTGIVDKVRPFFTNSDLDLELTAPDGTLRGRIITPASRLHNREMERLIEQFKADGTLGDYNVVFTTYDQLKDKGSLRRKFLETISPRATFILDECDLGGGASGPTPPLSRKEQEKQTRGEDIRTTSRFLTQSILPYCDSYVLLSATAFKDPYVLTRLLHPKSEIREISTDPETLASTLLSQGIPGQQDFCNKLALAGEVVRLEKDMSGVTFTPTPIPVDLETLDAATKIMAKIVEFDRLKQEVVAQMEEELKAAGEAIQATDGSTGQAAIESTNFTSTAYNFMQQFLFCLKTEGIAQAAIESIQSGRKPKIQFYNTMESLLEEYLDNQRERIEQEVIAEAKAENRLLTDAELQFIARPRYQEWLNSSPEIHLDLGDMLTRQLDKCRRVTIKDPYGERIRHYLTDDELGPEALSIDLEIRMLAKARSWNVEVSPVDAIIHKIERAGYVVGEMSGRSLGIDYSGETARLRFVDAANPKVRSEAKNGFNNGEVDTLLTNLTTGWSGHASRSVRDQRQREDIVAQAHPDGNKFMQGLGRVNRTGQVNPLKHEPDWLENGQTGWGKVKVRYGIPGAFGLPAIKMLYADEVPYEKRIAAERNRKMASLNANTTGSRSSGMNLGGPDFSDSYGDTVAVALMEDHPEWYVKLDYPLGYPTPSSDNKEGAIRRVTGRSLFLPLQEQEKLMQALESNFAEYVEQREAMGESPQEAKTLDLQAKTIGRVEIKAAGENSDSIFGGATYVEVVQARSLRKPPTSLEVANKVRTALNQELLPPEASAPEREFHRSSDIRLLGRQYSQSIIAEITTQVEAKTTELGQIIAQLKEEREQRVNEILARIEVLKQQEPADDKQQKTKEKQLKREEKAREKAIRETDWGVQERECLRLNIQLDKVKERLQLCEIGQPVRISNKDCSLYGIVTDVERVEGVRNPLAGGAWRFRVAVADAAREIKLKLSEVNSSECLVVAVETAYQLKPPFGSVPIHQLFDEMQQDITETRQIVTGNLLSSPVGRKYINFTNNHSQVRQGLLLPRNFDIEETLEKIPVTFHQRGHLEQFLRTSELSNAKLKTSDDALVLYNTSLVDHGRRQCGLLLEVASSKRGGGTYYKDPELMTLTHKGEFEKKGKAMQGFIPNERVSAFLDLLDRKFPALQIMVADDKWKATARGIKGESLQQMEWFKQGAMPDLGATELAVSPEAIAQRIAQQKLDRMAQEARRQQLSRRQPINPIQAQQEPEPESEQLGFNIDQVSSLTDRNLPEQQSSRNLEGLIEHYQQFFTSGSQFESIVEARKFALDYWQETDKPLSDKVIEECIEKAIVRRARDIAAQNHTPLEAFDLMCELYERQPHLSSRTSTSIIHQQYSTPVPIGLLAQQLIQIDQDTTVYEPTAGNGALLTLANPAQVIANELDPQRATELRQQGFTVTEGDATEVQAPNPLVDRAITNPPFGSVHDYKAQTTKHWTIELPNPAEGTRPYKTSQIDHVIAFEALATIKDDGKAALILGAPLQQKMGAEEAASDAYNEPQNRAFYYTLYNNYNVTQHFTISGNLYARQGTTFPIDVVIVEGRGASDLPLPAVQVPPVYRTWEELRQVLVDALQVNSKREMFQPLLAEEHPQPQAATALTPDPPSLTQPEVPEQQVQQLPSSVSPVQEYCPTLQEMRDWRVDTMLLGRSYENRVKQLGNEMLRGTLQESLSRDDRDPEFSNASFKLTARMSEAMQRDKLASEELRCPTRGQLILWYKFEASGGANTERLEQIRDLGKQQIQGTEQEMKPSAERETGFRNPNFVLSQEDFLTMRQALEQLQQQSVQAQPRAWSVQEKV